MAQVNITLSQEEVLQVLTGDRNEAVRFLLERILNEIMKAESEEQLGAGMHERTGTRQDYRNGTRERELNTRIGTLTLEVPRHRNEPFHTMVFENYSRSEASLIATMVQMVVAGVSTRKVEKVVETLCGTSFSKSTVSELCKRLDGEIERFRNRPLDALEAPFLMVDATYFRVREDHRVKSKAFLVAIAIRSDGVREVIGFDVHDAEDSYSWGSFFAGLRARGLNSIKVVISDAHKAIRKGLADSYPEAAWQRCQVHLMRNIIDAAPPKYTEGLKTELRAMFNADSVDEARRIRDEIVHDYADVAARAIEILEAGFEDSMTVMQLPGYIRTVLRSTNLIERMNRELKRRSDVIQVFPDAGSVMRLMGAVAIECSDAMSNQQRMFSEKMYRGAVVPVFEEFGRIAARQYGEMMAA